MSVPVEERFFRHVNKTDTCWLWTGYIDPTTRYGKYRVCLRQKSKTYYSHRLAYELFKGVIPVGLQIDHLCRNRACVNPDHLEPVTQQVNILRGDSPPARQARTVRFTDGPRP